MVPSLLSLIFFSFDLIFFSFLFCVLCVCYFRLIYSSSSHPARPDVQLTLGSNLMAANIKEGDDVYFDCRASALPPVTRLEWFHNVSRTIFQSHRLPPARGLGSLRAAAAGPQREEVVPARAIIPRWPTC
jgi:hypothetical protein